jgi:hypothetical protein
MIFLYEALELNNLQEAWGNFVKQVRLELLFKESQECLDFLQEIKFTDVSKDSYEDDYTTIFLEYQGHSWKLEQFDSREYHEYDGQESEESEEIELVFNKHVWLLFKLLRQFNLPTFIKKVELAKVKDTAALLSTLHGGKVIQKFEAINKEIWLVLEDGTSFKT